MTKFQQLTKGQKLALVVPVVAILLFAWLADSSPATIELFSAFDVDSGSFVYNVDCGAACNADGYLVVTGRDAKSITVRVDAIALTAGSIEFQIEGRTQIGVSSPPVFHTFTIFTDNRDVVADGTLVPIVEDRVDEIRVGLRVNGTDDGDAADESVSVIFDGF